MNKLPMSDGRAAGDRREPGATGEGPSLADLFAPREPAEGPGPAPGGADDPALRARVEKVLDELRPYIRADGGDVTLISVEDGVVKVSLHGACSHCGASSSTLKMGVEYRLREEVPEIRYVEAV